MKFLKAEFKHQDLRRSVVQLLTADIKQINIYEANYGAELGNHFHKETLEYFYIIRGVLKYNNKGTVKRGDLFLPDLEEKHTLKVLSDKATFMTFLTNPYNKENPDVWK